MTEERKPVSPAQDCCPVGTHRCGHVLCFARFFAKLAAAVALLAAAAWLLLMARSEVKEYSLIGQPEPTRDVVTVRAEGRVSVVPDVAVLDLGMTSERPTVAEAQGETVRVIAEVHSALAGFGVAADDMTTANYSIMPTYDWIDGKQTLRGYSSEQSVRVKVRDLARVGDILAKAADLGVNRVGGVTFEVDDREAALTKAREQAFDAVLKKAAELQRLSGLRLVRPVTAYEYENGDVGVPYYAAEKAVVGMGGGAVPSVAPGAQEIVVTAEVTYEAL
jgi:uncharacterized protein YggE